jgi:hypothetical protein
VPMSRPSNIVSAVLPLRSQPMRIPCSVRSIS